MSTSTKYNIGTTILLFCLFTMGCVKNEWIIEDNRVPGYDPNKRNIVYFNPRIESNYTRALTPFPQNCLAQIYTFNYNGNNEPISTTTYESLQVGTLSPVAKPISVPVGSYNFYAVSSKQDSLPPTFTNNIGANMINGTDYLWCGMQDINIVENGSVVDLTFKHCASQIVLSIVDNGSLGVESIIYAGTGVPTLNGTAVWDLMTGEIAQMSTDPGDVGIGLIDGLTAKFIFLPYMTDKENPVAAAITLSDGNGYMLNTAIPPLENGYRSGYSYHYNILIEQDTIIVDDVVIAPWIEHQEGDINVQ